MFEFLNISNKTAVCFSSPTSGYIFKGKETNLSDMHTPRYRDSPDAS